ncbi:MAG: pilin [Candidatus Parabeggiatoa sp.]|nr:pilin [Candidatus Parabeggiatoa sp.]
MDNKGFVLFDLMLTVTVIAMLAAVAIPAYSDYMTKSQVAESSLLAVTVKIAVGDYYAYHGRFPANNQAAGVAEQIMGHYVSGVEVINGVIEVTFGDRSEAQIAGHTLRLQPVVKENSWVGIVNWTCSSTLEKKYFLPKFCRK